MSTIAERAASFETVCRRRQRTLQGEDWSYFVGGDGPPVLLLTGGAGLAVAWVDLALALVKHRRVVAIDYPPIDSFVRFADGVVELLDAEGIGTIDVVGQSMGAMQAELLSRRAPDRVRSLVLSGAGLYGDEDRERLEGRLRGIEAIPWEQTQEIVRQSLRQTWKDNGDGDFWIGEIDRFNAGEVGKRRSIASYTAMLELIDSLPALQAAPSWPGRVLFLRGEDDPLMTKTHFGRLHNMHPTAELRSYGHGGHSLLLTRPVEFIGDVESFLAKRSAS